LEEEEADEEEKKHQPPIVKRKYLHPMLGGAWTRARWHVVGQEKLAIKGHAICRNS